MKTKEIISEQKADEIIRDFCIKAFSLFAKQVDGNIMNRPKPIKTVNLKDKKIFTPHRWYK